MQKARGAQSFLSTDNIFGTWTSFTSKRWDDPDWILCSTCRINIYQYDTARLSKYFHWNVITTTSQHYSATFVLIINHTKHFYFFHIYMAAYFDISGLYLSIQSLKNFKVPYTIGKWKNSSANFWYLKKNPIASRKCFQF